MKVVKLFALTLAVSFAVGLKLSAQAFDRDTRELTVFIGGADLFHIPINYNFNSFIYPTTGEAGVEGEFAIHKYVGLGFDAELGGRGNTVRGYTYVGTPTYYYTSFYAEFNMAFGIEANFHFYQLIADKASGGHNLHADKLDIYAGLNTGTGFAIHPTYTDASGVRHTVSDVLFYAGPQAGVRYFFAPKVAVNGEFGWGKTWARVGFTFKI
jgi:hypothetical protein